MFNRKSTSVIAPQTTLKIDPVTITIPGTRFAGDLVAASATGAGQSSPSDSEDRLPFILDPTKKILIRMENLNGADTQVSIKFTIVEH